jgi:hypothetical protein
LSTSSPVPLKSMPPPKLLASSSPPITNRFAEHPVAAAVDDDHTVAVAAGAADGGLADRRGARAVGEAAYDLSLGADGEGFVGQSPGGPDWFVTWMNRARGARRPRRRAAWIVSNWHAAPGTLVRQ